MEPSCTGSGPGLVLDLPEASLSAVEQRLATEWPQVRVLGTGWNLRVLKDTGRPTDTCARYAIASWDGYLAVAHTRMATESAVTVLHSHPFVPSRDLCVVHNGSFSNYATVRRHLLDDGVRFDSDNDSEVAARYLASRLQFGDDLEEATRWVMKEMDGFFTLVITSADEMSVVRDAFACKPAVVAETPALRCRGLGIPGAGRVAGHHRGHRVRAPSRGGLHVETLNGTETLDCTVVLDCDDLGTRAVNRALRALPGGSAPACGRRAAATTWPSGLAGDIAITRRRQRRLLPRRPVRRPRTAAGPTSWSTGLWGGRSARISWGAPSACAAVRRRVRERAPGAGASSLRATRRCGPASRSRAARSPLPATPAP